MSTTIVMPDHGDYRCLDCGMSTRECEVTANRRCCQSCPHKNDSRRDRGVRGWGRW